MPHTRGRTRFRGRQRTYWGIVKRSRTSCHHETDRIGQIVLDGPRRPVANRISRASSLGLTLAPRGTSIPPRSTATSLAARRETVMLASRHRHVLPAPDRAERKVPRTKSIACDERYRKDQALRRREPRSHGRPSGLHARRLAVSSLPLRVSRSGVSQRARNHQGDGLRATTISCARIHSRNPQPLDMKTSCIPTIHTSIRNMKMIGSSPHLAAQARARASDRRSGSRSRICHAPPCRLPSRTLPWSTIRRRWR
jgi:hypothetical protein